jgi:hypothetical protein
VEVSSAFAGRAVSKLPNMETARVRANPFLIIMLNFLFRNFMKNTPSFDEIFKSNYIYTNI